MAIVSLNTIKNWYKTGLKPTQAQFWDVWDSFRHKSDKVPFNEIEGMDTLLLSKADAAVVEDLVVRVKGLEGKQPFTVFKFIQKGFGNINLEIDEIGDIFCGWSNDGTRRISEGKWLGGSLDNSDNFTPLVQTEI